MPEVVNARQNKQQTNNSTNNSCSGFCCHKIIFYNEAIIADYGDERLTTVSLLISTIGYWCVADLVCPSCARATDLSSLTPIGGDDEELIAHTSCIGCGASYLGQGIWQRPEKQ